MASVAQLVGASSCEPKGRGFSAWSGHIRRFQIQSPVGGAQEATDVSFLPEVSLLLTLKTNNIEHVFYVPSLDEKSKPIWGGGKTGYTRKCSQWSFLPFFFF